MAKTRRCRSTPGLGAGELVLVAAAGAIAVAGILKLRRLSMVVLIVLNVALATTSAATVHAVRSRPLRAPLVSHDESIFRFSPTSNVLVILLDGLQADIAGAVFDTTPAVTQALEGFRYYKDTMAAAPTTFLSLPSIHSGAAYQNDESLSAHLTDRDRAPVVHQPVRGGGLRYDAGQPDRRNLPGQSSHLHEHRAHRPVAGGAVED